MEASKERFHLERTFEDAEAEFLTNFKWNTKTDKVSREGVIQKQIK